MATGSAIGLSTGPAIGLAAGGEDRLAAGFLLQGVPLVAVGRKKKAASMC